jgi:SAM-dependent methyltransferase
MTKLSVSGRSSPSPIPTNPAHEGQIGTATDATTSIYSQRSSAPVDPALASLPRRIQSPGNIPASRPLRGVIRSESRQLGDRLRLDRGRPDGPQTSASVRSHISLSQIDFPIGAVLDNGVMEKLRAGEGSSPMLLDGGKVEVSYEEGASYKTVRVNFGRRFGPMNIELDQEGQSVKCISGYPPPKQWEIEHLASSGLLQPEFVRLIFPPPVEREDPFEEIAETKGRIAIEVIADLEKNGIDLDGKNVLDVGSGLGFNAKAMEAEGAAVFCVEPDREAADTSISRLKLQKEQVFNGTLQEIPKQMKGRFDLVTVFLWNINEDHGDEVMMGLCSSIKENGKVIIGLHDAEYLGRSSASILPLAERYFANISTSFNNNHVNKKLLICSDPHHFILKRLRVLHSSQ